MKLDFIKRPLSFSSLNSFDYNPETWYETYILGKKQVSRELEFGSMVDKRLQTDKDFLPMIPRCPLQQYELRAVFNGIPLIGKPDALDLDKFILRDYKTGKNEWTKKRADDTGQLTMYLMLIYIVHKIPPEKFKCFIDWMPTQMNGNFEISFVEPIEKNIKTFKTKRTMTDLWNFGSYINETVDKMQKFVDMKERQ